MAEGELNNSELYKQKLKSQISTHQQLRKNIVLKKSNMSGNQFNIRNTKLRESKEVNTECQTNNDSNITEVKQINKENIVYSGYR